MKLNFTLLFILCIACIAINAQVAINTTGALPNGSAMLDVSSTNQGILVPRMTKDQKKQIQAPAVGLLVYQNSPDSIGFHYYTGTAWVWLGNSSAGWSITGNAGTDSAIHFFGTTDNKPLMLRLNNKWAGQLNASTHNNFVGNQAGLGNTTGTYNTALGDSALAKAGTAVNSTAVGGNALANKKGGASATAVGAYALQFDSATLGNTGFGTSALRYNKTSTENTALGFLAGRNITGSNTDGYNTYVGAEAGYGLLDSSTGIRNVGMGFRSMYGNTSGNYNVAMGTEALSGNKAGIQNIAIGEQALYGGNDHNQNTAVGAYAMRFTTKSTSNTAIGLAALEEGGTTENNVAVGFAAMNKFGTSKHSVAVGTYAMSQKTSGDNSVGIGYLALENETSGANNVGIGAQTLYLNQQSIGNVAIGYLTGYNVTGGALGLGSNTYVGAQAGYGSSGTNTGFYNTGLGYNALYSNATGNDNVAVGRGAGNGMITGSYNSFIGSQTDGLSNVNNATAIGYQAYVGQSNSLVLGSINGVNGATANTNVGIGTTTPNAPLQFSNALSNRKISLYDAANNDQEFFGFGINPATLRYQVNTTGSAHVFFAATSSTASSELMRIQGDGRISINKPTLNAALDGGTLQIQNSNSLNDILGLYSAGTNNRWTYWINNSATPNLVLLFNGQQRGVWSSTNGVYTTLSDRRLKKDIQPISNVLSSVLKIPSYRFHYNDNQTTDPLTIGFMAQEVQPLFPEAVTTIENKDGTTNLGINYQYMSVYAIKAIQEQQQMIEAQQKQINTLEARLEKLEKLLQK